MSLSGDTVIFIDAENVSVIWGVPLYVWLCQNYKVRECYCVGNRAKVAKEYLRLEGPRFHMVNSKLGKDSADTWLVMLGSRELCLKRSVKKIAILSNDRDFAPLAYLAAERKKKLVIYAADKSGVEGLKQAIKRTEPGEAASVEVIELDKLVGRQLEKPAKANLREKILTGARTLIKFPGKLWPKKAKEKEQESASLPSAEVMDVHTQAPGKNARIRIGKKGSKKGVKKRDFPLRFSQPDGASERMFHNLSSELHNYLARREDQIRLILAPGSNGDFVEIPFVEGMKTSVFLGILVAFKVIRKGNVSDEFYHSLGLVCRNGAVFYDRDGLDSFTDAE